MDNELKSRILGLTLGEILELMTEKSNKKQPWSRLTIGKLDADIYAITNVNRTLVEFSVNVPSGVLCNIKKIEDVESCLKEINSIIAKYQK